jgi:V/A-type H+-transporting ATPase subunit A
VREEIVRIKTSIPNDKLDEIQTIALHLEDQIAELERTYQKAATS